MATTQAEMPAHDLIYPGSIVREDYPDAALVRRIQHRLNEWGTGPIDEDGDFGLKTAAALRLFQARGLDREGRPLAIDGVIGPRTWEALFEKPVRRRRPTLALDPFLQKVLSVAETEATAAVCEDPSRRNRGPRVDEYVRSVGLDPEGGYAWCVCFIHYCFAAAARLLETENPFPKTGGVHDAWTKARKAGFQTIAASEARTDPTRIEPGQVFFINAGEGLGHAGLVTACNGDTIATIEGNTNRAGSREGTCVLRKTRTIRSINMGFVRPTKR